MPDEPKPVNSISELLARHFEKTRQFTLRLTGEFDEEAALWRPTEFNNNALWIAGHILGSSDHFRKYLGVPKRDHGPELSSDFSIGGCYHEGVKYPAFADITAALGAEVPLWLEFIKGLTAEDLARPFEFRSAFLPFVSDAVLWMVSHELMHSGQFFYIRRGLGKEPMFK
jgi:uncharacterized damage-inducible protein DinB